MEKLEEIRDVVLFEHLFKDIIEESKNDRRRNQKTEKYSKVRSSKS